MTPAPEISSGAGGFLMVGQRGQTPVSQAILSGRRQSLLTSSMPWTRAFSLCTIM